MKREFPRRAPMGDNETVPQPCTMGNDCRWYVMRDLTRPNAKHPAYAMLAGEGIRFFTPMTWKIYTSGGRRERRWVPVMHDLLFVYSSRDVIDPIVERVSTFQYRFTRNSHHEPMVVRTEDMERFIRAVDVSQAPQYFRPDEVTAAMCHRRVRIIGGNLDGYEGSLLTTRGSKKKRLLIELPMLLAAAVEVEPEYIQLL